MAIHNAKALKEVQPINITIGFVNLSPNRIVTRW